MPHRSRRWRKRFDCGHRGFGKYCHCCAVREMRRQAKAVQRKASREERSQQKRFNGFDLSMLPKAMIKKAKSILGKLTQGVHPGALGGKQFQFDRNLMRIPIGYRHRLLCRRKDDGIEPVELMTHEDYNSISHNTRR
ncbi:MAG TPA: hypothetical protein IGS17_18755 [Oscillatoriales cyanobacterium M59_W2019_021]|nr:hypothetical protein [Oscillatoriales cyanobacterium M4454_W2019_049]HIK52937.1 hypothetical protein [Oscillatoriales cyanobacterium M59_W2019_021]